MTSNECKQLELTDLEIATAAEQVNLLFAPLTRGLQPGVAVLVIHNGKKVHQQGYGYANIAQKIPITPTTAFRLGSVSKMFTALCIMQLAEQRKLKYDDEIGVYLPELRGVFEGVTIRHLLCHYDEIDTSAENTMLSNRDALLCLNRMGAARALFAPGTRCEYSNAGYDVLACIVEAAATSDVGEMAGGSDAEARLSSGAISFAEYATRHVFAPLGMRASRVHDHPGVVVEERATGYDPCPSPPSSLSLSSPQVAHELGTVASEGGQAALLPMNRCFLLNDHHHLNCIVGSGSIFSSLSDMYLWDQAWRWHDEGGRVGSHCATADDGKPRSSPLLLSPLGVSRTAVRQAYVLATSDVQFHHDQDQGGRPDFEGNGEFGWCIGLYHGQRRHMHSGRWVGFVARYARYPDLGLSIVLLSNRSDFSTSTLADDDDGHGGSSSYPNLDRVSDIYFQLLDKKSRSEEE